MKKLKLIDSLGIPEDYIKEIPGKSSVSYKTTLKELAPLPESAKNPSLLTPPPDQKPK